jgi:hypothetical protein
MDYRNLAFFDSLGNEMNFTYDPLTDSWSGSVHFPTVSTGLFESRTIYVMEKVIFNGDEVLSSIRNRGGKDFVATVNGPEFSVFTVDNPYNEEPKITLSRTFSGYGFYSPTDVWVVDHFVTLQNYAFTGKIDLCILSEVEGVFLGSLVVLDGNDHMMATVELYGEVEGEDLRLPALLANLGEQIGFLEERLLKDSDIDEDKPDYVLLNEKRKELIVELFNIQPYLSSYKGIVNVLKFFGYYDLELKEYWLDPETGKYAFEPVRLYEYSQLSNPDNYMQRYVKLSYFGLFYKINKLTGREVNDLPETEPAFQYSHEEVIIKLFGLRNYMRKRGVGGVAKILDIVGEATYFSKYLMDTWNDRSTEIAIDEGKDISFLLYKPTKYGQALNLSEGKEYVSGYVSDARPFLFQYNNGVPDLDPNSQIGLIDEYAGYFGNYWLDEFTEEDDPDEPIGLPVVVQNLSFDVPWTDIDQSWDRLDDPFFNISWQNISRHRFTTVEFTFERQLSGVQDTRRYKKKMTLAADYNGTPYGDIVGPGGLDAIQGSPEPQSAVSFLLPYDGLYNLTVRLVGYNGYSVQRTSYGCVKVEMKAANFVSYYNLYDAPLQTWAGCRLPWNKVNSEWFNTIYDNEQFTSALDLVQEGTFNLYNYYGLDDLGISFLGLKSPKWSDLEDVSWNECGYVRWKDLSYPGERLAYFHITSIQALGTLQVGEDVYVAPNDLNVCEFDRLANILDSLDPATYPDMANFCYTSRERKDGTKYVDAVSRLDGRPGDRYVGAYGGIVIESDKQYVTWMDLQMAWQDMPISWYATESLCKAEAISNPFTTDSVRVYGDRFDVPTMCLVLFNIDPCAMPGKSTSTWTVTSGDEVVLGGIVSRNLAYRFTKKGTYTVKVTIQDNETNSNQIEKYGLVRVMDSDTYAVYGN